MSNKNSESRSVRGGDGTAPSAGPGRGFAVPPGGGDGNVPTTPGGSPGGRGPGSQSFSAPQESVPAVSAAYTTFLPRLRLEDELDAKTWKMLLKYDREIEELPRIIRKLKKLKPMRWDP